MAAPPRTPWLSPHNLLALASQVGVRLGLAQPTLKLLVDKIIMPRQSERLRCYVPTPHDVFVATFAKSGTNWAMQICQQIVHRGAAEFEHIHQLVAWPEVPYEGIVALDDPRPRLSSPTNMRVIKTHMAASSVPYDPGAKYVTIIRDPKEVLVSAYYFLLGLLGIRDRISPAEWVEINLVDGMLTHRWAEHSASFWAWRDEPNVLVRTFDEVKVDHEGTVDAIAALMGVALTPDERAAVIDRSTFSYMKSIDDRFAPPRAPLVPLEQHPSMIRRGAAGGSDELIDQEARARIDAACREQLLRLGSALPYDALFVRG